MSTPYKYPIHSTAVSEFTEGRLNQKLPDKPKPMDKAAVKRCISLCVSELIELARTVCDSNAEAIEMTRECLEVDAPKVEHEFPTDVSVMAAQSDALVDMWYYGLDAACQHGMNLCRVFDEVHDSNMRKKQDGKFILQEIAPGCYKVIKPQNWVGPNVDSVIEQAIEKGSWV